jgi:hypothetical protein
MLTAMSGLALAQAAGGGQAGQAQPARPGQPGAQPGGRGQRGNFDPAQARQRMLDRIKEQLASPDDEWKVLQPKIEKIMDAQRNSRGGGRGGRGRGGQGGQGGQQGAAQAAPQQDAALSAVAKASQDLQAAVDDKSISNAELSKRLNTLHEAKDKARAELASAQKDLRDLLTPRQEAVLVNSGILD